LWLSVGKNEKKMHTGVKITIIMIEVQKED